MQSNKECLARARLYLILDTGVNSYAELLDILKTSLRGGVDIVQLRDKHGTARDIIAFCQKAHKIIKGQIPLIINDRVDLAMMEGVSGVHLGQDDVPLKLARRLLGARKIIGISCQKMEHARGAEREGADYIGFGSVFKTKTKPERSAMDLELLKKVHREIKLPIFAIGGINSANIGPLLGFGVRRVAVCRDICQDRNVLRVVGEIKDALKRNGAQSQ